MSVPEVLPPLRIGSAEDLQWDDSADVVVVGFGAAGACAAIEAVTGGADVVAVDRLIGGGDTAYSGGAVYAGGGTEAQVAAGFEDTVDNMLAYLRLEVDGAVSDATLRAFCEGSLDDMRWLERQGVRFGTRFWPDKTPFPPNGYFLFYSGSEKNAPFDDIATPVPRAHKTDAPGMGAGRTFYCALESAAERQGVRLRRQTVVRRLVFDDHGVVVGVEASTFAGPVVARLHRLLARLTRGIPAVVSLGPHLPALFGALRLAERRSKRTTIRLRARRGVVIAAGGYHWNRELLAVHAPYAGRLMPIGLDTDGSGLLLGRSAGAATGYLDNVGVFRMFVPPLSFGEGMLVDSSGRRFTNELYYSGRVGRAMRELPDRKAFLILDDAVVTAARAELPKLPLFSSAPARIQLARATTARNPAELAQRIGLDPDVLQSSLREVAATASGAPDRFGKAADKSAPLTTAPYYAIDVSPDAGPVPATMFSLGGLRVDETTGAVLGTDGKPIIGLYAAGRSAVGICSNSYVSGLSLADCVFSGRRAGRNLASGNDIAVPSQEVSS